MITAPFPLYGANLCRACLPPARRFFQAYGRLIWGMTKRAPTFWLGCFVGAMVAQFPQIAEALIRLALAKV